MVAIQTKDLTGAALDWAVAKCEGHKPVFTRHWVTPSHPEDPRRVCVPAPSWVQPFEPSTNWAQGGPIIERECIFIAPTWDGETAGSSARASQTAWIEGPTTLIAAMRCYVASKLGTAVEVPEELAP